MYRNMTKMRTWRRKDGTKFQTVAKKVKTYVKKQIAKVGEEKIHDVSLALGNADTTGQLIALSSNIAKGTGVQQRLGDECNFKTLEFRMQHRAAAAQTDIQRCRFVIFQDMSKGASGTPAVATFLQSQSNPISPVNVDFTTNKRYRVIYDKLYHINPFSAYGSEMVLDVKRTIKIDRKAHWTDGSVANGGQIYTFCVIDNATGAGSQYAWYARLRYTD